MGKAVIKRENTVRGGGGQTGSLVAVAVRYITCLYWYICKPPGVSV